MKITFWWRESFGKLEPACETDVRNQDGVSMLSCLLTDSGGGHYLDAVPWLKEGLRCIESVKRGDKPSVEWARDAWAANISLNHVTIFSLYQEDYAMDMDLDAFEAALRAWIDFIQTPPDANASKSIEV
jgi:hypothetical protein